MKVIQPFFMGTLGGLALAMVLLVGLYISPVREPLYFQVDPEIADVRGKLTQYRDWLAQADFYIAEKAPGTSDSLQTAQTLAWREYKKWRTHLGELAKEHSQPTAAGFWTWAYSLRYWAAPVGLFLVFFPAFFLSWRARNRFRPSRKLPRSGGGRLKAQSEALTSFQAAVKKVAKISEMQLPPTDQIPVSTYLETPVSPAEPETKPLPLFADSEALEAAYLQSDTVWNERVKPAEPETKALEIPSPVSSLSSLSMEDEDGESGDEGGPGVMPPTTEVERVERRKDQVLKLARKGLTSSEISRRMRISQDQVEFIIRLRREKG